MHFFKNLEVLNLSIDLIVDIYKIANEFFQKEQFGMISQATRSAVSIATNIAEGCGRNTTRDFNHFLNIAMGSSFEIEPLILTANRIGYLDEKGKKTIEKFITFRK